MNAAGDEHDRAEHDRAEDDREDHDEGNGRLTMADLVDDLAGEFADVQRRAGPDGVDYLVGAQPFARVSGATGHFRLRPEIVKAAVRTPGAAQSRIGGEWVAFDPRDFDQYAIDRAQSWFELAHRLAAEAGAPSQRH